MPFPLSHRTTAMRTILRAVTVCAIVALWLFTSLTTAFFWTLFLVWAVWRLDPRIIGGGTIALLVLIPIMQSTEDWAWTAETLAVWVYFLLCITVGLQVIELVIEGHAERRRESTDDARDVLLSDRQDTSAVHRETRTVSDRWKTACSGVRTNVSRLLNAYRTWSPHLLITLDAANGTMNTGKVVRTVATHFMQDAILALCVVVWLYTDPVSALFWTALLVGLASGGSIRIVGGGALILCIVTILCFVVPSWAQHTRQTANYTLFLLCTASALYLVEYIGAQHGHTSLGAWSRSKMSPGREHETPLMQEGEHAQSRTYGHNLDVSPHIIDIRGK